jgi:hypothetical protein
MKTPRTAAHLILIMLIAVTGVFQESTSHSPSHQTARTKIVLLGTGTPVPDPDRSGPATAIVVDDRAYLVDFDPALCGALSPLLSREGFQQLNRAI